jgi:hypothetical protein
LEECHAPITCQHLLVFGLLLIPVATALAAASFRYTEAKHGKDELKYINDLPVLIVSGTPEEIGD